MKILVVHQNFPGQFAGLVHRLADDPDVELVGFGTRPFTHERIRYHRYAPAMVAPSNDLSIDEAAGRLRRAQAVAAQARLLKMDGFLPDLVLVHSGWGEALYLRDIFPDAKLVCYCEYYYRRSGGDHDFDPEFPLESLDILHRLRVRNAFELASVEDAAACISPTAWQRSTYPRAVQSKIEVIHEGVDVDALSMVPAAAGLRWRRRLSLDEDRPVLTYAARYLEPHRGFHVFMRALPELLATLPALHVLVIGSEQGGYGALPGRGKTWKDQLTAELRAAIDWTRVSFLGSLSFEDYVAVLRTGAVHLYLTYPFVLSWSALEAMAMEKAIVASATKPVTEFMTDGETARLVDFFDVRGLARAVAELVRDEPARRRLGQRAEVAIRERGLERSVATERLLRFLRSL